MLFILFNKVDYFSIHSLFICLYNRILSWVGNTTIDEYFKKIECSLVTMWLLVISLAVGFMLALPMSIARVSQKKALWMPVWVYTYIFRGTPLYVQLLVFYSSVYTLKYGEPLIVAGGVNTFEKVKTYLTEFGASAVQIGTAFAVTREGDAPEQAYLGRSPSGGHRRSS